MIAPVHHHVELENVAGADAVSTWTWAGDSGAGPVVVLAHGAGSRGDHPVHVGACEAVARTQTTVVAFNFPYAEAGRRSPDRQERLLGCYRNVAAAVEQRFPGRPLVAGGRSMGGRMASLLAADGYGFAGLVLLNYPLVPSRGGPDSPPRTAHWPDIEVPVLFVHGTRDRLFPAELFEQHRESLRVPTTVHVVTDADHTFRVLRRTQRTADDVYAEVGATVGAWLQTLPVPA